MARIAKQLFVGTFNNGGFADAGTVPAGKKWEVVEVICGNSTANTRTCTVAIKVGGTDYYVNRFNAVPANTVVREQRFIVLNAGDKLRVASDGASVGCVIVGIEVDV